ncbi:amidohydrolase [Noviherbaspirillum cavernae]|uniref:Amidohydrolase n=1 Tax=Noviherbaspirillum cavernae TaxID=2320862 RepID=A0A418X548_9BURK|nr:amidohydrolase family protein [Noviherbaspirillum cavernae]RJG07592.1 amidohydrolase [Noviherbaspirillum cavernae]
MMRRRIAAALAALAAFATCTFAQGQPQPDKLPPLPLFDAHMHYNVEARSLLSPQQVIALWRKAGIRAVLATSRPNDGTLDLIAQHAPDITIVPFLRPYRVQPDRYDWFSNSGVEALVEKELQRGIYRGIGEFHIFGADADAPYVAKIARLARERGLWLHAHADADAVERILRHAPGVKLIWAHTGMTTPLDKVEQMFAQHPTIVGELSYRSDVEQDGALSPRWKQLMLRYPSRFVVGTDTWITPRWGQVEEMAAFYRRMLSALPRDVAERIAYRNGMELFDVK